jgi:hypothetical protein
MAYTKEQLAECAAKAAELRKEAHTLEAEQKTLNEHGSAEGDRHWMLGTRIRLLRDEANRVYAPVLEAMEDEIKNGP